MSNNYNQYFSEDKATLYQKRQYDPSQLQNSTTINSYLGYNQYDIPRSILAFPFFTGSLGNSGPTLFLDGLTPRGSKVYTLLMDVNITSTNPIGLLFNIHSAFTNVFVIDTVTNTILNTYSLYANASQSYSAIKPVIGTFAVKQEGISSMNDLLGTLLDAIVTTTNFDWTTCKDKPMSTQIGMEHKEGDVDARQGVTCTLLGSPFIPEVYCNNGSVSPIHVNKMFSINTSTTTVYIKPFSTIHVYNAQATTQSVILYYDSTGGSTITVASLAISGFSSAIGTYPFPITRIVVTNTPVYIYVDELGELAPIGYVRVSGANAARTVRLSFRVACETHPLADKMMDINMFTPDLQFDHDVFRQTMKMAKVMVAPSTELVGRAWTWAGLLKGAFEMLKPTLYSLGTKLLEKLKPVGQAGTYTADNDDGELPKKLVGKAMTSEGRLKSNESSGYMIIDCYAGAPIITNSVMAVDPIDGSEISLLSKNKIPDFIRSLMVMNGYSLCYIHIGDVADHFDKSMIKGFAATGKAMMKTGAQGAVKSAKIKGTNMKEESKNLYMTAISLGIDLVNLDFNKNRVAKLSRVAPFPINSYIFFPAYIEGTQTVDKIAIFLTGTKMKDKKYYIPFSWAGKEIFIDTQHFDGVHKDNLMKLAYDLFSYAWEVGNFSKDPSSTNLKEVFVTFVPQQVDYIEETSYTAALVCLFSGVPSGQYVTGAVELDDNKLKVGEVRTKEKLAAASDKCPLLVLKAGDEMEDERIFSGAYFFHGSQLPGGSIGIYCREFSELFYVACTPLSFKNYSPSFEHLGLDPLESVVSRIKDEVKAALLVDGNLPKEVFSAMIKVLDNSKPEAYRDFDENPSPTILKLASYINPVNSFYGTKLRVKKKFYIKLQGLEDYLKTEKDGAGKDVLKLLDDNKFNAAGVTFYRTAPLAGPIGSLLEKDRTINGVTKSYFVRLKEDDIIIGEYQKKIFKEFGDTYMTREERDKLAAYYRNMDRSAKIEKLKVNHAQRMTGKVSAKKLEQSQQLLTEIDKRYEKKEFLKDNKKKKKEIEVEEEEEDSEPDGQVDYEL